MANNQHDQHLSVDIFQTGSGTSSNINVNEVIARIARKIAKDTIHPNDHVSTALSIHENILPSFKNAHTDSSYAFA